MDSASSIVASLEDTLAQASGAAWADAAIELAWQIRRADPSRAEQLVRAALEHTPSLQALAALFAADDPARRATCPDLGAAASPLWQLRRLIVSANQRFNVFDDTGHGDCQMVQALRAELGADVPPCDDAAIENLLGRSAFLRRDLATALAHFDAAAERYRGLGWISSMAMSMANAGNVMSDLGDPGAALQNYLDTLQVYVATGHTRTLSYIFGNAAVVYWRLGLLDEARSFLLTAQHHAADGQAAIRFHLTMMQILVELTLGELHDVDGLLGELARRAEALVEPRIDALVTLMQARASLQRGEAARARALLDTIPQGTSDEIDDTASLVRGRLLLRMGQRDDGIRVLLARAAYLLQRPDPEAEVTLDELSEALAEAGRHAEVAQLLRARLAALKQRQQAVARVRSARVQQKLELHAAQARESEARAQARRLREQLVRAQRLEAVGQLAAGIAHDFNNLLTVILTSADLLAMEVPPGSSAAASADAICAAGQRASALTRRLLTFARRSPTQLEAVALSDLLDALRPMLRAALPSSVAIDISVDPAAPSVRIDRGLMDQVILNLVINARDAMPQGGAVRISASPCPGGACLSVEDTGAGIAPGDLARIFDPFFSTKPPGQGTGLGLATVWGIVEQLGGRVTVNSALGEGTTFTIELPAAP